MPQLYGKPESIPFYINEKSNHKSIVLKQLPKSVAKRISYNLSDEKVFSNSIQHTQKYLAKAILMID